MVQWQAIKGLGCEYFRQWKRSSQQSTLDLQKKIKMRFNTFFFFVAIWCVILIFSPSFVDAAGKKNFDLLIEYI